jgi:hypothetical protein
MRTYSARRRLLSHPTESPDLPEIITTTLESLYYYNNMDHGAQHGQLRHQSMSSYGTAPAGMPMPRALALI